MEGDIRGCSGEGLMQRWAGDGVVQWCYVDVVLARCSGEDAVEFLVSVAALVGDEYSTKVYDSWFVASER